MACGCQKKHTVLVTQATNLQPKQETVPVREAGDNSAELARKQKEEELSKLREEPAVKEALEIDIISCYECVKKHLGRAQAFFEEYHTGYSQHSKNLMNSLQVAEEEVQKAFLLWQKTQAQLDMAAGELLGNDLNADTMRRDHIQLANDIREVRLRLNQDPLFIPNFDILLVRVQKLEYAG